MMDTTLMSLRVAVYDGLCEALTYQGAGRFAVRGKPVGDAWPNYMT
jgi:hypothetical protein